jgi:MoxR-like ATPase
MIEELIEYCLKRIGEFGAKDDDQKDFILRNNTSPQARKEGGAFFGFIHPDEETSGPFHDFCVVIFPDEDDTKPWLLSLGVGSMGFLNDYELAQTPGFRRSYESILSESGFCKTDFTDLESKLPNDFENKIPYLKQTLKTYSKVLPVCEILEDPLSEESKNKISAFLAIYAKARGWIKPRPMRLIENYEEAVNKLQQIDLRDDEEEILRLINNRRFVILTGAPGTGKTRLARIISKNLNSKSFFIQFHAETDYSDFIYGITPKLDQEKLGYTNKYGIFYEAIKFAINNPDQKVLLIVDEINRANLSNILGPIFYLFEYRLEKDEATEEVQIGPGLKIKKIPDNFYMIGTMNTADRSLAVVDFALRRRFAWYDIKPRPIDSELFQLNDFNRFRDIFYWFASSNELSLQPGQGYFLANDENEFMQRLEFELLPLIREYLNEQLMLPAKEEFNNYFFERINKKIFD